MSEGTEPTQRVTLIGRVSSFLGALSFMLAIVAEKSKIGSFF